MQRLYQKYTYQVWTARPQASICLPYEQNIHLLFSLPSSSRCSVSWPGTFASALLWSAHSLPCDVRLNSGFSILSASLVVYTSSHSTWEGKACQSGLLNNTISKPTKGWVRSLPHECLPSMQKAVGLVPRSNHNNGSKNNKEGLERRLSG